MLPESVRLGTSSWAYEGWQGQVYHRSYAKHRFSKDCLGEYAVYTYRRVPLFRAVGLDHSFYRPPSVPQLAHYAAQVPDDFHICPKVWEDITIPAYADHPRYGDRAGKANPHFLDAAWCDEMVLRPLREGLGLHAGPLIFEFQRYGGEPATFLPALDRFFSQLPQGRYAVEIRNPFILGPRYAGILRAHGVAHVYNHWTAMPPLATQHEKLGGRFTTPLAVVRLLTPLGLTHARAVERFAPYRALAVPQPKMRADVLALIRQALDEQTPIYVLANNRAEGNAPATIQALVDGMDSPAKN